MQEHSSQFPQLALAPSHRKPSPPLPIQMTSAPFPTRGCPISSWYLPPNMAHSPVSLVRKVNNSVPKLLTAALQGFKQNPQSHPQAEEIKQEATAQGTAY